MSRSVAQGQSTKSYSQDLFSPLQLCEVVEENQRKHLEAQINTVHHISQPNYIIQNVEHQHLQQASKIENTDSIHKPSEKIINIKSENLVQNQLPLLTLNNHKSETVTLPSMELYLANNTVHLQSLTGPMVSMQQQPLPSSIYEVQLASTNDPSLSQLHLNPIQIQPPLVNQSNVENGLNVSASNTVLHIINMDNSTSPLKITTSSTISTQTNPCGDEPTIIYTKFSKSEVNSEIRSVLESKDLPSDKTPIKKEANTKVPIPTKRTWCRPWKKKKEREKKPVSKVRKAPRRRKIATKVKKTVTHIDPRNGPPIDTNKLIVKRQPEESLQQIKQKRQRIKLCRNSGQEYVNRLGKVVSARKIGSPCNCPLRCWERMGSKIVNLFNSFWDLSDFDMQNSYLFTCLKLCDVKRRYTKRPAKESRRQNTFEYFVRVSGKHIRICKKAFMSAHGLNSDKRIRSLLNQMKDGALIPANDKRGKYMRDKDPLQFDTTNNHVKKTKSKVKIKKKTVKKRVETVKPTMYFASGLHHCATQNSSAHVMQDPHPYIPNGEIYFPGHYLDPHQAMSSHHVNQLQTCHKMIESPAYFMAGMKENTFHQ